MTTSKQLRAGLMRKTKAELADQVIDLKHHQKQQEIVSGLRKNRLERQLRHAIEMLPHPVIIYDLNDHLVFFNRAYHEFFPFMPQFDELAGKYFLDVIQHSIDAPGVIVDPQLKEDPEAYREKRLHRLHNPPQRPFEQYTTGRWQLVSEHRIKELGFFSIRQDITDRVMAERALAEAKDEAETANRAKSAFLAAMSHEIRTPMNGVIGMSELLRETDMDGEQFRMTETIRDSAFSLLQIIDDILDFSKIEAGKLDMEVIPFSVRDTVEGVTMNLLPEAVKKDIRLRINVDPDIPEWLMGDPGRVRQILFNLVGNAIKFIEKKSGQQDSVFINAERIVLENKRKAQVRFSVRDTGIGITEETLAGLFEPFTQAERSTTRKFGGSGLGLSISKNLTDLMNGEISVESELGNGSTFTVDLTFDIDRATPSRGDEPDLSGLRSLMVVAQDDAHEIAGYYLENKGCVVALSNDLEATEEIALQAALTEQSFDIIIIGSTWPKENLERAIASIRKNQKLRDLRFVVLTEDKLVRRGMIDPDMVIVSDFPLRRSAFLFGVAMAAGRASPKLFENIGKITDDISDAPTLEKAAATGRLILVAEDNPINQEVIIQQLNKLGYAARVEADGKQAFEAWQDGHYALLLTDCHMPEMDGYQLAIAIREAEVGTSRNIPIIAITANLLQGEGERCLEAGMDDFLPKPLELYKFKQTLLKWMPNATAAVASAEDQSDGTVIGSNAEGPVDPAALIRLVGNDPALHLRLLGVFIEPARETAVQIEKAFYARDAKLIGELAHKLKSSAGSIGAKELSDTCLVLETAGITEEWKTIDNLVPKLGGMVDTVEEFINNL
jgi:PAS domain S-box-containing protein